MATTLVLADVGADLILNTFFNATAQQNLLLKLNINDVTPADTDTTATYTIAAGGGYADKTLTNNQWTVTAGNDPSDAVYAEQEFVFTGALTDSATIYGYWVTNAAGTVLVFAQKLDTAFTPATNGDTLKITPKFQLSKGTPA